MASSHAQLRSSGNIREDRKRLWRKYEKCREWKDMRPVMRHDELNEYIDELWWVISRLNFTITELEHPEWYDAKQYALGAIRA